MKRTTGPLKHSHPAAWRQKTLIGFGLLIFLLNTYTETRPLWAAEIAQVTPTQPGQMRELGLLAENATQPVQLNGPSDQRDFYISVPPNWILAAGSYLELKISHSPLLLPQRSALTLALNTQPLDSVRLDNTNQRETSWKVALPVGVKPDNGQFKLSLSANLQTGDQYCPPANDPSGWLTVLPTSRLHLAYTLAPTAANLADLPELWFGSHSLLDRRLAVVVSATPSASELARASQLIARLGSLAGYDGLNLTLSYGAASPEALQRIFVGGPALYPALAKLNLPLTLGSQGFNGINADTGVIQLINNQDNEGLSLILSGNTDQAVDRAVGALLDDRSLAILHGAYALVQPGSEFAPDPQASNPSLNPTIKSGRNLFANLGFSNQTVYGVGQHESRFSFFIPGLVSVSADAQLGLDYSYAGLADSARSSMTVLLNDIAVQATPLPAKTAAPASGPDQNLRASRLNLILPKDLLHSGDNTLVVRWNFSGGGSTECGLLQDNSTWGSVYRTSELTIPTGQPATRPPDLAQLPYPFSGGNSPTLLVLPDKPSPTELRLAAQLAAELSRNEPAAKLNQATIIQAGQVSRDELAKYNLVLVGTPANHSLLAEINTKLPVQWDSATVRTLNTRWGLRTVISDSGLAGLVEIARSPWNAQQSLLAVLVPQTSQPGDLEALVNSIGRQLYIGKFRGNLMVLDNTGKTYSLSTLEQLPVLDPDQVTTPPTATLAATNTAPAPPGSSPAPAGTTAKPAETNRENSILLLGAAAMGIALVVAFIFFVRGARRSENKKGPH